MQLSLISLALTRIYGGAAGFSPLSLFAAGEQGAWYDPSDLSTMFQDSAGTTPVTADGQPVGKILDKSGRGNHATQATAASRPLYKTNGTYHWLQFDGVDDSLSTAAIDFTATDKMSAFCGVMNAQNTTFNVIFGTGNINSVSGSFQFSSPLNGGDVWVGMNASQITSKAFTISPSPLSTALVYSTALDLRGTSFPTTLRKNGNAQSGSDSGFPNAGTGNYGNLPLVVGARGGDLAAKYSGRIYSLIVRGALSTTQEITDTETWVNSKTGAY